MSSADERDLRRPPDLPLTLGVFFAVFAALLPLIPVVQPWPWLAGATLVSALVLGAGYTARRYRLPAVAVSLAELALWALAMTFLFFRDSAFAWFLPTPATFGEVPEALAIASSEITLGAAPLEGSNELSFLIVGATALLAIVIDHVVLTARMPLLAAVGLIAVSLIPSIAVPGGVDVATFVMLAVAILFLMRADSRARETPTGRAASRDAGVPATALGIGAIAIVVAIAVAPLLPQPGAGVGSGSLGVGSGIDVSLQLGDDLRRPRESETLRVRSDMSSPPYLRAATLSNFTGAVWEPDRSGSVPLEDETALDAVIVADDIRLVEYKTSVEVQDLVAPWLPVAFPAVAVTGLEGEWEVIPYNRTVITRSGSTAGQTYEVVARVPRPTLEQIRASSSGGQQIRDETTVVPEDLPAVIRETAFEVTAAATTDYDALVALQRWFRGGPFKYSLDAPVDEGFDGSGAQAIAKFLEVKKGYCVHFASAFALMARTLAMPSRIVVGYLPGTATTEEIDEQTVYTVASSQLHAWPEVYFDGIGWVPFEPTAGLGIPTSFAASTDPLGIAEDRANGIPAPAPSASATIRDPAAGGDADNLSQAGQSSTGVNPLPTLGLFLGILLVVLTPALIRAMRTRQLLRVADQGDAVSAWLVVLEAAIDLGIPVPASESPRGLGHRMISDHDAPPAETTMLVRAVERASYAPGGGVGMGESVSLSAAASAVRAALYAAAPARRRLIAQIAPRSLVIRPGSVYAVTGARTNP